MFGVGQCDASCLGICVKQLTSVHVSLSVSCDSLILCIIFVVTSSFILMYQLVVVLCL